MIIMKVCDLLFTVYGGKEEKLNFRGFVGNPFIGSLKMGNPYPLHP